MEVVELLLNDPFHSLVLSDNWDDLAPETKRLYLLEFKKKAIKEWEESAAKLVANHAVELGFNKEQISYSQASNYKINMIYAAGGNITVMEYHHCTYFLINDKLVAMSWSNGVQIGDTRIIETYSNGIVVMDN